MMIQKKTVGVTLASAAAALLIAGASVSAPTAASASGGVKCMGINSCAGTAECKTASNECKGMNSCKGHGWVHTDSADDCTSKGGTVVE